MMLGTIYSLNFPNGKQYIGQTRTNPNDRFRKHCSDYVNHQSKLGRAWRKHGKPTIEVLCTVPVEDLNEVEAFVIELCDSLKNGYNSRTGGLSNTTVCTETRRLISEKLKGKKKSQSHKIALAIAKTGFRHSDETKRLMSENRIGKKRLTKLSEDQRVAIRQRLKGVAPSDECQKAKVLATSKPVICVETKETFSSASAAAIHIGMNKRSVANGICLNRKVGGLSWRYL